MNTACSRAYAALGKEEYRDLAIRNHEFCRRHLKGPGGIYHYFHSYKAGQAKYPAFLDDYSYLIASLIDLQEITGDTAYLLEAGTILDFVIDNFTEAGTDFFFFTHQEQPDLIVRKKEVYDGATPSGNSMMAFNLLYLSVIFDEPEWGDRARRMAAALHRPVTGYPGLFWNLGNPVSGAYVYYSGDRDHRQAAGKCPEGVSKQSDSLPGFPVSHRKIPISLITRQARRGRCPQFFLCKNYACQLPVNELSALIRLFENVHKVSIELVQ